MLRKPPIDHITCLLPGRGSRPHVLASDSRSASFGKLFLAALICRQTMFNFLRVIVPHSIPRLKPGTKAPSHPRRVISQASVQSSVDVGAEGEEGHEEGDEEGERRRHPGDPSVPGGAGRMLMWHGTVSRLLSEAAGPRGARERIVIDRRLQPPAVFFGSILQ